MDSIDSPKIDDRVRSIPERRNRMARKTKSRLKKIILPNTLNASYLANVLFSKKKETPSPSKQKPRGIRALSCAHKQPS